MDWRGLLLVTFWSHWSDQKGTPKRTDIDPRFQWNDPPAQFLPWGPAHIRYSGRVVWPDRHFPDQTV